MNFYFENPYKWEHYLGSILLDNQAKNIYRTLYFCQKVRDVYMVFYGHSIHWELTSLDYEIKNWKKRNVQGNIYVFFSDLPELAVIDKFLKEKTIEIVSNSHIYKLKFDWDQKDQSFLTNDLDEDEYKPFSSLCTRANYYYSEANFDHLSDFFHSRKKAISRLEKDFFVPLMQNSQLLNTFTIYNPTRIETHIKKIRNDGDCKSGVDFIINDTFNKYQNCKVEFVIAGEGKKEKGQFILDETPANIETNFDPEYFELSIRNYDEDLYIEKGYFLKSISVNMNAISGGIKTEFGTVKTHSSSVFTIGEKHD